MLQPSAGLALLERACIRKRRYATRTAAVWTLDEMRKNPRVRNCDGLRAYPCPFCGGHHLGHGRDEESA